jgi:hypothetical protein
VADVNLVWKNDEPLHRTVPRRLVVTESVPGEYAVLVGQQQTIYTQVTAHGYATVVVAKVWVGKPQLII